MSEIYQPCVEDATAHIHVDWKTHESTGRFAPYSRAVCSTCPPLTPEEDAEELRKYLAYEQREIRKHATRKPSQSLLRKMHHHRIPITAGALFVAYLILHFILR